MHLFLCIKLLQVLSYQVIWCLLLQTNVVVEFTQEELEKLTERIQNAGTEVVNAKAGAVSHQHC